MGRRLKASDPTKATRHKPGEVEVRNIAHPAVWKLALRISENHPEKIKVETFCRVWITLT